MDIATAVGLLLVIAGSLAYTELRFRSVMERVDVANGNVSARSSAESEDEEPPLATTTRLTMSQKRTLLEAAAAQRVRDRMAR